MKANRCCKPLLVLFTFLILGVLCETVFAETQNFNINDKVDGESLANGSTPYDYEGFTYKISTVDGDLTGTDINWWASGGVGDSPFIGVAGSTGNIITTFKILKTDNNSFTATSLWINSWGSGVTIKGYLDNIPTGQSHSITSNGVQSLDFTNVDELRFEGSDITIDLDAFIYTVSTNATPSINLNASTLAYTENNAAKQVDGSATVSDSDGDADWNGGTLKAQVTANSEAADELSIADTDGDGTTITISGTNLSANGTDVGDLSTSEGVVTGGAMLTITFDSDATNTIVQEVLQSIRYRSTSNDPGTSNRTVTMTATDTNAASASDTRTISMTAINDSPSLTATGSDPTFTEGGSAAGLFSSTSVSTVESGQTLSALVLTTTNVTNGSNERLNIDGTAIVLTHGTSGTTATNSLSYSVSVTGTTATISLSGGTLSAASAQTLVNAISYQNNSNSPNTSDRVVTLTSLTDSGGTADGGSDTASLSVSSTAGVVASNDAPTLTATGSNPTFTEGGTAAGLYTSASVSTVEAGQTLSGLTLTVTNVSDATETLAIDGTDVILTHGASGTTSTNSLSYAVSLSSGTATVTLSGGSLTTAATQTLINGITYSNSSDAPSTANRVVTLTSLTDSGGTANGGSDTASLTVTSTVSVSAVNDAPVLSSHSRTLTSIDEDNTTSSGTTVADVIASAGTATDVEGDTLGVAVTSVTDTNGTWQYTTDGSTWNSMASASPAAGSALLLASDDKLRFVPSADYYGSATGGVTFKAWDGTSGSAGDTSADTTSGTAWSSGTATASITVDAVPGFTLTESGGTTSVAESGSTDTFTAVLASLPGSDVVLSVVSGDIGEATVDKATLTFTAANWDTPQSVTVTGVDDNQIDGDISTTITVSVHDASSNDAFDDLPNQTVTAVTSDDDVAGMTVSESSGSTSVTEAGSTDTFTVVLDAQPASNVVVAVTSGDTSEATVDKATLTFTNGNWATPQAIIVTGVDDNLIDGTQTTTLTLSVNAGSSDDAFDAMANKTVSATTTDNDTAGFTLAESGGNTSVSESGTTDTFTVVLDAQPGSDVVIGLTSGDTSEATVSAPSLTFASANWNTPQTVTITGVDDVLMDGPQTTTITMDVIDGSSDDAFDAVGNKTVTVTTSDNDSPGLEVTESSNILVSESGTTDSFTVTLTAQPASDVVLDVSSEDTGEASIDKTSLTFTPANWSSAQTVTVSGVNDPQVDGNITTLIRISVNDAASADTYDPVPDETVSVTTTDNEVAGFTVTESSGSTLVAEHGPSDALTISLTAQPLSDVILNVSSGNTGEATVSPGSLTFTPSNWSTVQEIAVSGVDDHVVDGSKTTTITIAVNDAGSDDHFDDVSNQTVTATTTDNSLSWTGGGANTNWSNTDNWNAGRLPGASDTIEISGGASVTMDQDVTLAGLTLGAGFTGTMTQGTWELTIDGDFIMGGGTFAGGSKTIDVNGAFTQTGGTLTSTSAELQVSGHFTHSGGTFTHNAGTVVLDGDDQDMSGSTTFNRLTKITVNPSTLTFEAGTTQVVEGVLKFVGSEDARLTLESSVTGNAWYINPDSTVILDTLDVRDCENTGSLRIGCANSHDSGDNVRIDFLDFEPPRATLANHPESVTNSLTSSMTVGGIGVTHYMYRLNDDPWSDETSIEAFLTCVLSGEGTGTLHVTGKNSSGAWQREDEATELTWRVDLSPPTAVTLLNSPAGTMGTTSAAISVGGEDVTTYKYALDGGAFGSKRSVDLSLNLSGLSDGAHTLKVIGADGAGNWMDTADAEVVNWTVNTSIPTAVLTGTPSSVTQVASASITVTGEDAGSVIDGYTYTLDAGTTWQDGIAGEPIVLSGLAEGDHTLHVNASSGGNWQDGVNGKGNTTSATTCSWTVDQTPPSAPVVTAAAGTPGSTSMILSWAMAETVERFRIWYAESPISDATLSGATEVFSSTKPAPAGSNQQFAVNGLTPGQSYSFVIKLMDAAGNVSVLSNSVSRNTENVLPVISDLNLTSGDNSAARPMSITGSNYLESQGSNIVRFENSLRAFQVPSEGGTSTVVTATVPMGAPPGTYNVRVINKYGISRAADETYTVSEAALPFPVVTSVSPAVVPTGTATTITVSGANFGDGNVAVNLIASDGTVTALGSVPTDSSTTLTAHVNVALSFPEGQYIVQVDRGSGIKNEISAVKLDLSKPVDLSAASGALTTTRVVEPDSGEIPVETTLTTDNRDEVDSISAYRTEISVTFEAGTILEEQNPGDLWENYDGLVNPPRQVPLTDTVEESLGTDTVLFTLGADGLLRLKDGATFFVEIDVTMPADVPVPKIYYVPSDGTIELAGVQGTHNGIDLSQGGTVLATRYDVPEDGLVTYTIGLLMDHMSTYAAGTEVSHSETDDGNTDSGGQDTGNTGDAGAETGGSGGGGSFGPCFIGSSQAEPGGLVMGLVILVSALFAMGTKVKRLFPVITIIVVILVLSCPSPGAAEDTPTIYDSPWSVKLGLGLGFIGEEYTAYAGGTRYNLDVDNVVSPMVRVGYAFSHCLVLEVKAAMDLYSGDMNTLGTNGSSSLRGYTFGTGPLWYLKERQSGLIGAWKPFIHGEASYRALKDDLSYPVNDFHSTIGLGIGVGVECGQLDIRLGYNWAVFDESGTAAGYTPAGSSDDLDLSAVVLEVLWNLPFHE